MLKNKLMKCCGSIIRVLEVKVEAVLIVDCLHKSMPKWVAQSEIASYEECAEQELTSAVDRMIFDYDSPDKASRRFAHEHYALIAGVLPLVGDEKRRSSAISAIAEEQNVSKQTIMNYLWLYLVHQDIAALAPKKKATDRALTQDERICAGHSISSSIRDIRTA